MTTIPNVTSPPPAPSRNMLAAAFIAAADAFVAWLVTFAAEMIATITAMNTAVGEVSTNAAAAAADAAAAAVSASAAVGAVGYVATSSSSFSATTGSKAFVLNETARAFAAGGGEAVVAVRKGDLTMRLYGVTTGYASNTLTVNVTKVTQPGGPFTDWVIFDGVFETTPPQQSTALAIAFAIAL